MGGDRDDRATKPPPFDPEAYAAASDERIRAAEAASCEVTSDRKLPSFSARPRVVMATDDLAWLELSEPARRVLPMMDGASTVLAIMETRAITVDDLFKAIEELVHEGVISLDAAKKNG